jgi:hypothetical protein
MTAQLAGMKPESAPNVASDKMASAISSVSSMVSSIAASPPMTIMPEIKRNFSKGISQDGIKYATASYSV